jgi:pyruvate ferredoxin oxidoreductase beta subunit
MKHSEVSALKNKLAPGHRLCAGCGESIIVRQVLMAAGEMPVVAAMATGCLEVTTTIYPYNAWRIPMMHVAFENTAAVLSGVESTYRKLKRDGKISKAIKFIAFGGDGATYDIGFQALSGALERGHNFTYICLNNEAYMNTGIQRSSATPLGAATTTSPAGKKIPGRTGYPKNLTKIIADHGIPYVAQASPSHPEDFMAKVKKALEVKGPAFINAISPCVPGWRYDSQYSIHLAKLAVETCVWPLYEVIDGKALLTSTSERIAKGRPKRSVVEWLKLQGRFKHLFAEQNKHVLEDVQEYVDRQWGRLKKECEEQC